MGSAITTFGGDPIPATTDGVLVPADISAYAEAIAHKIVHWAADQAERDVLYAAAAAPVIVASPNAVWLKISGSGGSSVWKTIWADTGAVTSGIVAGTNFDSITGYVRKINGLVVFAVQAVRRNSALPLNTYNHATSPGNIVGDPAMFTFPAGYRPDVGLYVGTWRSGTTDGAYRISTGGDLGLFSGNPNTNIAQDDQIEASGCFVAA